MNLFGAAQLKARLSRLPEENWRVPTRELMSTFSNYAKLPAGGRCFWELPTRFAMRSFMWSDRLDTALAGWDLPGFQDGFSV